MTRYIFVTGGVVSSLGKGLASAALGALPAGAGLPGSAPQVRSLPQRRSGHHEPVPARRGLRHRRRRRDRPRPRALRALHRRAGAALGQRHRGPDLPDRDREGTARRLPRRHRAGDPPRHRCDQGGDRPRQRRRRLRSGRDRRHGGRHRGPALLRIDPPVRLRARAGEGDVRAPDARALHRYRRRAQDQADPAFGEGAAQHRHRARSAALPREPPDPRGRVREDRAVLQRARRQRDRRDRRGDHLPGAAQLSRAGLRYPGHALLRDRARAGGPISPAGRRS